MTKNAAPQFRRGLTPRRRPVSRRLALVGAVVVLGLTACGSPDSASEGPSSSVPAPAVIRVAGAAGGGAAPVAADASMESSTKMMPASLTYEWNGQAPDLTSAAASWFFPAGSEPTIEQVQAVAAAFGVTGDVVELAEDMGGGWSVGPNDGTGPSITVAPDAMQSWWYSPAWAITEPAVDCAYYPPGDPAADPATADLPVCEEPQPPANVPTKEEAETKARELFAALGVDASQYEFETYADEWNASVSASLVLDGVRTNVTASVGFGGEGEVTWAGGFLATPQRGADYPRIGVEAAIQRLNDQSMMWLSAGSPIARDVAVASAGMTSSAVAEGGAATEAAPPATEPAVVEEPAPTDATDTVPGDVVPDTPDTPAAPDASVMVDPMPVDCTDPAAACLPVEPMEPIVVDLTAVEASLEQVWAEDGTVWLLPGYLFSGAEGALASVLAVEDQYLQQADPEPMPAETVVVDTAVAPPASTAEGEGEGEPAMPTPGFDVSIVGLTLDEATRLAEQSGWTVRVAIEDGVDLALTMDYSETRVNVAVEAGVITEVLNIG